MIMLREESNSFSEPVLYRYLLDTRLVYFISKGTVAFVPCSRRTWRGSSYGPATARIVLMSARISIALCTGHPSAVSGDWAISPLSIFWRRLTLTTVSHFPPLCPSHLRSPRIAFWAIHDYRFRLGNLQRLFRRTSRPIATKDELTRATDRSFRGPGPPGLRARRTLHSRISSKQRLRHLTTSKIRCRQTSFRVYLEF